MSKISIARALIELKTLDKRISKKLHELEPITVEIGDKLESGISNKEEFEKQVKSAYQSLIALIDHKRKLKAAIVKSNAMTIVDVSGVKMTVAEAIERKSSISIEKEIKKTLSLKYTDKLRTVENHNKSIQDQLYKLLQATYSKSETEISKEDYEKIAIPFKENNDAKLINPLDIKKTLQELDDSISEFESEVDIVLTESNARTEVEI